MGFSQVDEADDWRIFGPLLVSEALSGNLKRFFYNWTHFFGFLAHFKGFFLISLSFLSPIIKKSCYLFRPYGAPFCEENETSRRVNQC